MVILAKLALPFDPAKIAVISCISETPLLRRLQLTLRCAGHAASPRDLRCLRCLRYLVLVCPPRLHLVCLTTISIQRRLLIPRSISASTIVGPGRVNTNNGTSNGNRGTCLAQPLNFLLLPGGLR